MPTTEHLNIPTYEQFDEHLRLLGIIAGNGADDAILDSIITATVNGENTTRLFWAWFPLALANQQSADRYALLDRFFAALAKGWDKTYTLRSYDPSVSTSSEMTPLDDLAGKSAGLLCTEISTSYTHWMDEDPMYWYIRANALSLTDGTMNILYFEGEDGFDITGQLAPVYTFKMAKWVKDWGDDSYDYISWRATQAAGYRPYAGDVAPDNSKRHLTWLPTFPGGLNASGGLTSGAGLPAYNLKSASDGITAARITTAYEGLWNDCDTIQALHDWRFRHFDLENSNILEGCTNYNHDYTPAVAETGVERVILTPAQAANLIAGSTVSLTATARASTGAFTMKKIKSITAVEISNTTYAAVNIDNGGTTFDTDTTMHLCTMPWHSGATEAVPGHADGCTGSLTAGKTPIRVGGVEYMHGAYDVGLDPLYNVTAATDGVSTHKHYAVYECRDSVKLATSITANYVNTGIAYENMPEGWQYVKAFVRTPLGILFPKLIDGGSAKCVKSAFNGANSAGVRCPWRFGDLSNGGYAGLACEHGNGAPSISAWSSRPRLSGAGKKRGEWAA